jgi:hypothetical protein
MKNLILLFVISAFFFSNCSRVKDDIPKLTFNDKAYIKIIAENSFDSLIIRTNYSSYFPLQPCLMHQMIIKEKGDYYTSYRVTKPELVLIAIQDTFFTYMIPRDTLVIKVGSDTHSTNKSLVYHKIDDPIYTYLQKEFKNFGSYYFRSPIVEKYFNTTPTSLKDLEKAISVIDSAQKDRLAFLEKNMNGLPKWFINTQKSDYVYLSANIKYLLNYYLRNRDLMGEFPFLDVKIYNPEAKLSSSYYRFISEYFLITYSNKSNEFRGPLRMINLYNKASREINYNLKGEILRNFNVYLLTSLYKASDSEKEIDSVDKSVIRT